jgi:hypothetical protein
MAVRYPSYNLQRSTVTRVEKMYVPVECDVITGLNCVSFAPYFNFSFFGGVHNNCKESGSKPSIFASALLIFFFPAMVISTLIRFRFALLPGQMSAKLNRANRSKANQLPCQAYREQGEIDAGS